MNSSHQSDTTFATGEWAIRLQRQAAELARVGGWRLDLETGEFHLSSFLTAMLELPADFAPGRDSILIMFDPASRSAVEDTLRPHPRTTLPIEVEAWLTTPKGRRLFVRLVADAERDGVSEIPRALVGSLQDITSMVGPNAGEQPMGDSDSSMNERVQSVAYLESTGLLASCVAHDFNNLLMAILSSATMAMMDLPPGSPVRENVEVIERTAKRAAELTRQLLAFSGKTPTPNAPLYLGEVVMEMGHLLRKVVDRRVRFDIDLGTDLPPTFGNRVQVGQVVMNLITNAADSVAETGGGQVRLSTACESLDARQLAAAVCAPTAHPGDYVVLTVEDTGAGMPDDLVKRVFDPFFTTKKDGHGLGLAAALSIIKAHHGFIEIESESGVGTTFRVGFPAHSGSKKDEQVTMAKPERGTEHLTVLVVDDEEMIRSVLERILKKLDYQAMLFKDGKHVVEYVSSHPGTSSLVLLDVTMPGMNGFETAAALAEIAPELPVLLMSGYSENDTPSLDAIPNVCGFLAKPFRPVELSEQIRKVLES